MKYFKPSEFRGWFPHMNHDLLEIMDNFRELWGDSTYISPANGGIGRKLNPPNKSYHNILRWGEVMAIDLMPRGMTSPQERERAYECAVEAGALGIGIYPDWKPRPGIHLDVGKRPGRGLGNPAKWSAFRINRRQRYFELERAFR